MLWTDVDGIMSADPRIIKNAKILEQITYPRSDGDERVRSKGDAAKGFRASGSKGNTGQDQNTFNPKVSGTVILSGDSVVNGVKTGVKAVGSLTNVGVVNISGTSIVGSPGTAVKIFEILKILEWEF